MGFPCENPCFSMRKLMDHAKIKYANPTYCFHVKTAFSPCGNWWIMWKSETLTPLCVYPCTVSDSYLRSHQPKKGLHSLSHHVYPVMCIPSCVSHHVYPIMCIPSCVYHHVYTIMCIPSCVRIPSCVYHHVYHIRASHYLYANPT